jgi:hypothetical protein
MNEECPSAYFNLSTDFRLLWTFGVDVDCACLVLALFESKLLGLTQINLHLPYSIPEDKGRTSYDGKDGQRNTVQR